VDPPEKTNNLVETNKHFGKAFDLVHILTKNAA